VNGIQPGHGHAVILQILRTSDALWEASRSFFDRWGVTPSQFNVLNLLYLHSEGLTQTDLSRELITNRSNITGLVDRLQKLGLVKRESVEGDRRAWRIVLSETGRSKISAIQPEYYKASDGLLSADSPLVKNRFLDQLKALEQRARNA
jgi:DNA-binding MarR family transcriptional regulator